MFHKLRKVLVLLKEINKELCEAVATYKEFRDLVDTDDGGLTSDEASQVLEDFTHVKDNLEEIGRE